MIPAKITMKLEQKKKVLAFAMVGIMIVVALTAAVAVLI